MFSTGDLRVGQNQPYVEFRFIALRPTRTAPGPLLDLLWRPVHWWAAAAGVLTLGLGGP